MQIFLRKSFFNILALLLGCITVLSFAPFEYRFIPVISLAGLLGIILRTNNFKQAFISCYCFGVGMFGLGVSWVYYSLHVFGQAPSILAGLITALLVLILAGFVGLVGLCQARYFSVSFGLKAIIIFPSLWLMHEWLHSWVLSGFPWLLVGYSQVDTFFAPFIPTVGALGMSGIIACLAGCMTLVFMGNTREKTTALFVVVLMVLLAVVLRQAQWVHPVGESVKVALVQGNIPQSVKLEPEFLDLSLERYVDLSRKHYDSDIIIWPETAIPTFKYYAEPFLSQLAAELDSNGVELLTGIFYLDHAEKKYYNSMYKLSDDDLIYSKRRLVPFGEYMPFRWVLSFLSDFIKIPMSDISTGEPLPTLITLQGIPVAISICYESAYSDVLRKQLPEGQMLINASNDAWFGDSLAPHQHLEISRVRALELGRYMLRATNTGISAIIDSSGEVLVRSTKNQDQVLKYDIEPYSGQTLFARMGNYLSVTLALSVLVLTVMYVCLRKNEVS